MFNARVRRVQPLAWAVLLAVVATALLCAAPAGAAEPKQLGQAVVSEAGGCHCVVAQFGTNATPAASYEIPSDGVLTLSEFYVGKSTASGEWVRAGSYRRSGPTGVTEMGRGEQHFVAGLAFGLHQYLERIPVKAGDLLGGRYETSAFIEATPRAVATASANDKVGIFSGEPSLGSPFTATGAESLRANVLAVLEPDEDADGYGDASQDLCPGSPLTTTACSGALFGSNLQGERSTPPLPCLSGCLKVQTQLGGVSTAASFNGVVVRWRVLNGVAGSYRARVLEFNPGGSGGMFRSYHVLHSSAAESVTAPAQPLFSKISTFQTRLPIATGDYVGLSIPGSGNPAFQESGGAATYSETNDGGDGLTISGTTKNGTLLYDADIEPDADGDGYGDVSQDSCPAAAAVHEGLCPAAPGGGGGGDGAGGGAVQSSAPPAPGPVAPTINSFAVKPRSFRAKPLGRAAAKGTLGTKLKLNLSAAATVTLTFQSGAGKRLQTLTKSLGAGPSSVAFNGQIRRHGKVADLAPGAYRVTARAASDAGTSPAKTASFTVLPPLKFGRGSSR